MNLNDFTYKLPDSLIAQQPLHRRDQARLMIIDKSTKKLSHDIFSNVENYLPKQSCLVLNDSKVVPARLLGKRASGGNVEIFLLSKKSDGRSYEALMRPMRRLKQDEEICFNGGSLIAKITDKENRIVQFNTKSISKHLDKIGHIPLPPYIKRSDSASDRKYYQTVYANKEGSVASPTAGLHFTNRLLEKIKTKGHKIQKVTLHINYATFKPVEAKDITKHQMHFEDYDLSKQAFNTIQKSREKGSKIVAVGTTSCRVLESISKNGKLRGSTNIFMYPGYKFKLTDILITNFHLPKSTLLMLVYAFGGQELMKKAYREAVKHKYRFFSYGDAMMII